jgi:protein-S-isoprenylcysteine O-methyltransferase
MFTTAFSILFALWGLSEVVISMRLRTKVDSAKDGGTLKLVLIAAYASLGVATYLAITDDGVFVKPSTAGIVGLAMIVLGIVVRMWAIATLRQFFTVNVTLREGHTLIRRGPYRWIRHPSYTGSLLSFYGFALAIENVWAALVVIVPITYAFFVRMRVEEAVLRGAFPEEYPAYERETRRLVPFVY